MWESARKLNVDYNNIIELSDWLLFQHYEREVNGNVIRVYEDGSALVTAYDYDGSKDGILVKTKTNLETASPCLEEGVEALGKVALLKVFVRPASRRERLYVGEDGVVVFETTEPPVRGRANAALIKALSKALGVSRRDVSIVRGLRDRVKVVAVEGLSAEEALSRIRASGPGS